MSAPSPWSEFSHDPHRPETAALRASDQDRDVVLRVLADGLRTRAEQDYRRDLRNATSQVVVVGALMTGIWVLTRAGYFWPGFVILAVAINVLRLLLTRNDLVDARVRELEKKQRREIERRRD